MKIYFVTKAGTKSVKTNTCINSCPKEMDVRNLRQEVQLFAVAKRFVFCLFLLPGSGHAEQSEASHLLS
jgi:hypothetical protein